MKVEVLRAIRPTLRAAGMLMLVFVTGTVGYRLLASPEQSWLDALYMTTITLTTVGYKEVVAVSGRPTAELFTVFLMLTGVGTFVYFFSNLTAFLVEGTLDNLFRRRRMERLIDDLSGHHVVCGAGRSGEVVVRELMDTGRPFVVIEESDERLTELRERIDREFASVAGDATEDEVLLQAGIERAGSLVSCVGSDKDNLLVVFTARNLQPGLRIVAQSREAGYEPKLRRAGADAVVSPDQIGGLRMISETLRPAAVSFLDLLLRDKQKNWRVEEVTIASGSSLEGQTVGSVRERGIEDMLLMALRRRDGEWIINPGDALALHAGTEMVFMASPDARTAMERVTSA